MTTESKEILATMDEDTREIALALTSALLARMDLPPHRDEAVADAVALFWQVVRQVRSLSPEQARPEAEEFRIEQKQQP
jgi:Tfp pilus assembly protein PilV